MPDTAVGGRRPLPGEHGVRVFFGFYENVVDTMRRIPFASNPNGVFDNLVAVTNLSFARDGGRRNLVLPIGSPDVRSYTPHEIVDLVVGLLVQTDLPPAAVAYFATRLVVFLSSCDARRVGEWQNMSWSTFAGADRFSEDYRRIIVKTFSELFQASKAEQTSAAFPGVVLEWVLYSELGVGATGPTFRTLNPSTNEAFIEPWLATLRGLGVHLHNGHNVERLELRDGRIASALVRTRRGTSTMHADWYVCALPVERARALWNRAILRRDPRLAGMFRLSTAWMNGMKFFLREPTPVIANGGFILVDAPWTIAGVSQAQLWSVDFANHYGDGRVKDCISIDISNWTAPGVLYGKAARDCSPDEIANEVWEQMKRHLNKPGQPPILTDDLVVSYDIDQGMLRRGNRLISEDPLVLPTVGEWPDRPATTTAIPNLLLAGDYLQSDWEVANMETASYNGRRAANALLQAATSPATATPAAAIPPYRPPEWEPLKQIDAERYSVGQPNLFDIDLSLDQLNGLLKQAGTKLAGAVA